MLYPDATKTPKLDILNPMKTSRATALVLCWLFLNLELLVGQDFGNLKLLCGALNQQGMPTATWHKVDTDNYQCISTYVDVGPKAKNFAPQSNIAYYVTGTNPVKANEVSIVANQHGPETAQAVRQKMVSATIGWFKATSVPLPPGLIPALSGNKSFTAKTTNSSVAYGVETNRKVLTYRVVISPPTVK